MAASDYFLQGGGAICPAATLGTNIGEGTLEIPVNIAGSTLNITPAVGMGIMINGEFCVITAMFDGMYQITRGCADTIPTAHDAGSMIWFFENAIGTDYKEYLSADTLGVKVLMRTTTRVMTVESSPPWTLPMAQRFARPYPPGKVLVGTKKFFDQTILLNSENPVLPITWAHRNRVSQGDQLIGHEVGSIAPEPGTTYTLRVWKIDGTLVRTIAAIEGTSVNYSMADALADFAIAAGHPTDVLGYMTLQSVRDGFTSRRFYRIEFTVNAASVVGGWGAAWGYAWGG